MTNFYNSLIRFLMDKSFLILSIGLCLGILGLIIKIIIKRNSYQNFLKLIRKDFRQAMKKLDQLEDDHLKKKIITDGKHQLDNRPYQRMKNHLIESGILKELLEKIKTGTKQERLDACHLLDEFATPEALDYCTIALYDDEQEVRKLALETLADHATPKVIDTLIDYYSYCKQEQTEAVQSKLTQILLKLGKQNLAQLSEAALNREEDYQFWLINLFSQMDLSETQQRKIGKVLLELLTDKLARVRKLAVKNITDFIINEEVIDSLLARLSDNSPQVKQETLRILSDLDLAAEKVGPRILQLLTDNDEQVRVSACQALLDLGNQGLDYLIRATENEEAKETIVKVLSDLDTEYLITTIKELYVDTAENNLEIKNTTDDQGQKCG